MTPNPGQELIFCIVTGDQEDADSDTVELARFIANNDRDWLHIHSRRQPYCKGAQLNFAIDSLPLLDTDWIAVYDIDGRPSALPNPLDAIGRGAPIQQQIPLPTLASPSVRSFQRVDGMFQTCHVLLHEVRLWNKARNRSEIGVFDSGLLLPASYIWGNGIIFNASFLKGMGGFGVPIDDIPMGYAALGIDAVSTLRTEFVWHEQFSDFDRFKKTYTAVYNADQPLSLLSLVENSRHPRTAKLKLVGAEARLWAARVGPFIPLLFMKGRFRPIQAAVCLQLMYLPAIALATSRVRTLADSRPEIVHDGIPPIYHLPLAPLAAIARCERFLSNRVSLLGRFVRNLTRRINNGEDG